MSGPSWVTNDSPIDDPLGYGQRAIDSLRKLKHPKSRLAQQAFQLDPPFERIVRRIYGPVDEHNARLTRVVYLQIGKGSRKTSLAAALLLLHTCGPEKVLRGEAIVAAADRKQARIAFEEAMGIVDTTARLKKGTRVVDSRNRIVHLKSGSKLEAISSDAPTQHGRTPHFAIVDELWAHKKQDLFHAIRTGLTKIPGSLLIIPTTAGRGSTSADYPFYEYAKKVQSGELIDPHFLPIVFEASKDDRWDDERTWSKVLPGLAYGYPDLPSLRQLAREAKERPADRAAFEQFYLGIRQDSSAAPFVEMRVFDEGLTEIDVEALAGRPCWLGVDVSTTTDLSAIVAAFPDEDGGFTVLCWAFVPADNLQARADRDGVPYPRWAREGWISATLGNVIDHRAIEAKIRDLCTTYDVQEIGFDKAYATAIMSALNDDGFPVVTIQQGWVTQSPALNTLERAIISRKFRWNSPVLRWCMENVSVHDPDSAGNRVMHKGKSKDRIDLAVASWMAVSRASAGQSSRSAFDDPSFEPEDFLIKL